jgi:hypothetical protein
MEQRKRIKQTRPLEERLAQEARRLREEAELLPHGSVRDAALRRARQAETGSHIARVTAAEISTGTNGSRVCSPAQVARLVPGLRSSGRAGREDSAL